MMKKNNRRRSSLVVGGSLLLLSTIAPFLLWNTVEGEALATTTKALSKATVSSMETATTTAEGGAAAARGEEFVASTTRRTSPTDLSKVRSYPLKHSPHFRYIHNALWKKSVGYGHWTREELMTEATKMNAIFDRDIAKYRRMMEGETDQDILYKINQIVQDKRNQKIDVDWLRDDFSTAQLQQHPLFPEGIVPRNPLSAPRKGAGGGGGGWGASLEVPASASMPEDLSKLHSELVTLSPLLQDVPLSYMSPEEESMVKGHGNASRIFLGFFKPRERVITLNKTDIERVGLSVGSLARHEAAHALERTAL